MQHSGIKIVLKEDNQRDFTIAHEPGIVFAEGHALKY
jgi:hypothetical protein